MHLNGGETLGRVRELTSTTRHRSEDRRLETSSAFLTESLTVVWAFRLCCGFRSF